MTTGEVPSLRRYASADWVDQSDLELETEASDAHPAGKGHTPGHCIWCRSGEVTISDPNLMSDKEHTRSVLAKLGIKNSPIK